MKFFELLCDVNRLNEMTNLNSDVTNIGNKIWIDDDGESRKCKHNKPRIKFEDSPGKFVPMDILNPDNKLIKKKYKSNNYKVGQVKRWINLNRDVLLKYWKKEIGIDELKNLLKKG